MLRPTAPSTCSLTATHNASFSVTNVWGIKMNEWWDPDYSTLAHLTETGYMTVTDVTPGNTNDYEQSIINEGPFMVDYEVDGKTYYSLMFSVNGYAEKNYGVWQAIGESPLGTFTKLPEEEGGLFLTAMDFNYISVRGTTASYRTERICTSSTISTSTPTAAVSAPWRRTG